MKLPKPLRFSLVPFEIIKNIPVVKRKTDQDLRRKIELGGEGGWEGKKKKKELNIFNRDIIIHISGAVSLFINLYTRWWLSRLDFPLPIFIFVPQL